MMGKLKDYIIKKMGGYTAKEYEGVANIRLPEPREITRLDLVYVKSRMQVTRIDVERMGASTYERLLKVELIQRLMSEVEPIVKFTIREQTPGRGIYNAEAELQVVRPAH